MVLKADFAVQHGGKVHQIRWKSSVCDCCEKEGAMKKVREGLYIGNYQDAGMVKSAEIPPVSHVLSLVGSASASPSDSNWSIENFPNVAKLQRLVVPLLDVDAQNLLDSLESCLEFIEKGRNQGGVLVHCIAGVSRR